MKRPSGPGLLGLDPQTWFALSAALSQGAEADSFGVGLGGVASVLQNRAAQQQAGRERDEERSFRLGERKYGREMDRRQFDFQERQQAAEEAQAAARNEFLERQIALEERKAAAPTGYRMLTAEEAAARGLAGNQSYQVDESTGHVTPISGTREGQFSADQSKIAGFADRMASAHAEMIGLMDPELGATMDPTARFRPRNLGLPAGSQEYRQYDRAKRDFASAVLRRETGAQINDSEFRDVELRYFPMPGDGDATVAAKAAAREEAIRNYVLESGGAFQSRYGEYDPTRYSSAYAERRASLPGADAPRDDARFNMNTARITSDAEFEALPSGAVFVGPDGVRRRKP